MPVEFWAKMAKSFAIGLSGALPTILLWMSGVFGEIGTPTAVTLAMLLSVASNAIREARKPKPEGDGGGP